MTEYDKLQAFLSHNGETMPRKPAPPLPIVKNNNTVQHNTDVCEHELKQIRDEMVKTRYILEDIREGRTKAHIDDNSITLEQYNELKALISADRYEMYERKIDMLLIHLAQLRDDILTLSHNVSIRMNNITKKEILDSLECYGIDIMNILSDFGVNMCNEENIMFDPTRHNIIATVDTDDPALHGRIVEVIGDSYIRDERYISKMQVKVYRYVKDRRDAVKKKVESPIEEEAEL